MFKRTGKVLAMLLALALALSLAIPAGVVAEGDEPALDVAVYFDGWGIYSNGLTPEDVFAEDITSIIHAFFEIVPTEDIIQQLRARHSGQTWYPEAWTNDGDVPYTIRPTEIDATFGGYLTSAENEDIPGFEPFYYEGHFAVYERLCALYPDLKVIISVGGWNKSGNFSMMAYTPETRKTFTDSCIQLMKDYPFLAGVDLDWEYPGSLRGGGYELDRGNELAGVVIGGLTNAQAQIRDRENFTILLKEMREAFDEAFPGEHKKLGFCASSGGSSYIEFNVVQDYVDRINLMNYDGAGSWSSSIAHHTSPNMVNSSLNTFLGNGTYYRGLNPLKINVGAATYGRGWWIKNIFNSTGNNGLVNGGGEAQFKALRPGPDLDLRNNNAANATAPGTTNQLRIFGATISGSRDSIDSPPLYRAVAEFKAEDGWIRWDDPTQGGVLYFNNNPDNEWYGAVISYDDLTTIQRKADIILNRGVGGVIFWSAMGDSPDPDKSLSRAIAKAIGIPPNRRANPQVSVTGPAVVASGPDTVANYTISATLMPKVSGVELEFEIDGGVLGAKGASPAGGFTFFGDGNYGSPIYWRNEGNIWTGKVTLINADGVEGAADLLNLAFNVTEGFIGVSDVKLTYILMSFEGDNVPADIKDGVAETAFVKFYVIYDLNKDGVVDLNDITAALQYYMAKVGDPDWDKAAAADVNNSGVVDIDDLLLILANYTIPYYAP